MDDPDYAFAETPTGSKAHLVDFGRQSALALGTDNATDYISACGEVPTSWDRLAAAPDPSDACRRCAQSLLTHVDDLPVDRDFLMTALGVNDA